MVKEENDVIAFPSRSRCPYCGSIMTRATCKYKWTQYRKCLECHRRFTVQGVKAQ